MTATNNLVPVSNPHPVDLESQQAINDTPARYNKAVTYAKLGAMAGVCAATAGLMLADLAKMHNIALPIEHTPGRKLLALPVNGTCPEGQVLFNHEEAKSGLLKLLWISLGVCPGIMIAGASINLIPKIPKVLSCASWTVFGAAFAASGIGSSTALGGLVALRKFEDGHCYPT